MIARPVRSNGAPAPVVHGHSLWLLPDPAVGKALAGLIRDLARALGTPPFDPHVTLVGSTRLDRRRLVRRTRALASRLAPIDLRLGRLTASPRYFRALVLEADRSGDLRSARRRALEACEEAGSRFVPHLSLVYGTFTPEARRTLVRLVGRAFTGMDVRFTRLAVVRTRGPVSAWQPVAVFPLHSHTSAEPS